MRSGVMGSLPFGKCNLSRSDANSHLSAQPPLTNLPEGGVESCRILSNHVALEPAVTRRAAILLTFAAAVLTTGAAAQEPTKPDPSFVVAATTSVEDSGLFDHILPRFTAATGITVRVVSRASATALMTAEKGTIDVVIVNDAAALDSFGAAGQGTRRLSF